jgi:hypothetical protein
VGVPRGGRTLMPLTGRGWRRGPRLAAPNGIRLQASEFGVLPEVETSSGAERPISVGAEHEEGCDAGTSNAELRLDRKIASKRVYPAVDIAQSSTRKEELLLTTKEMAATRALRRALEGRDSQQAIDMLLDGLRKTHTNTEFLTQLTRTTPHNGSVSGTAGR